MLYWFPWSRISACVWEIVTQGLIRNLWILNKREVQFNELTSLDCPLSHRELSEVFSMLENSIYTRKDLTCTASCLMPLNIYWLENWKTEYAMLRFVISDYIGKFRLVRRGLTHRTTYVAEGLYSLITTTQLSGARSTSWANSPFCQIRPLTLFFVLNYDFDS